MLPPFRPFRLAPLALIACLLLFPAGATAEDDPAPAPEDIVAPEPQPEAPPPEFEATPPARSREHVRFDAETLDAREAFVRVAGQVGFNLVLNETVAGDITLDLNDVLYDEALKRIAAKAKVELKRVDGVYIAGNVMITSAVELDGAIPPPEPNLEADPAGPAENHDDVTLITGAAGIDVTQLVEFVARSTGEKIVADKNITHRVVVLVRGANWKTLLDAVVGLCNLSMRDDGGVLRISKKTK